MPTIGKNKGQKDKTPLDVANSWMGVFIDLGLSLAIGVVILLIAILSTGCGTGPACVTKHGVAVYAENPEHVNQYQIEAATDVFLDQLSQWYPAKQVKRFKQHLEIVELRIVDAERFQCGKNTVVGCAQDLVVQVAGQRPCLEDVLPHEFGHMFLWQINAPGNYDHSNTTMFGQPESIDVQGAIHMRFRVCGLGS